MKYLLLSLVSFCFLFCTTLYSQTISNSKIETFKVWGNCGMCKKISKKLSMNQDLLKLCGINPQK
jgi:hypothetical protein